MKPATLFCLTLIALLIGASGRSGDTHFHPFSEEAIAGVPIPDPAKENAPLRDSIVRFAMTLLGTPYVAGACSKNGFDCSGLVFYVFRHFNIAVPRSTSQFLNFGKEIPVDSLRAGDVLLFLSPTRHAVGHVGIVVSPNGKESIFIHASSGSEMKVILTSLSLERYNRRFVKALNVF